MIRPLTSHQRAMLMVNALESSLRSQTKRPRAQGVCRICRTRTANNQQACVACGEQLERRFLASHGLHKKTFGGFRNE